MVPLGTVIVEVADLEDIAALSTLYMIQPRYHVLIRGSSGNVSRERGLCLLVSHSAPAHASHSSTSVEFIQGIISLHRH